MKKKLISAGVFLVVLLAYKMISQNAHVTVQPIGQNAIFVGENKQGGGMLPKEISPEARKRLEDYQRDVIAVDMAWEQIGRGDAYLKEGRLQEAAEEFKKAYATDGGSRHVSGFDLAETYEKLGRYDEAIMVLEGMIERHETNAFGVNKANEMKDRLLAEKMKPSN